MLGTQTSSPPPLESFSLQPECWYLHLKQMKLHWGCKYALSCCTTAALLLYGVDPRCQCFV